MIRRLVKMTFKTGEIDTFKSIFNSTSLKIKEFEGCQDLLLLQDVDDRRVIFTLSVWKDKQALEQYRNSQLFFKTWNRVKALFDEKPKAWSTEII